MKKIRERFTIVERLIFLLLLIIAIIIIIPIINDKIEQPKINKAKENANKYIDIVNGDLEKIKVDDENLFNQVLKYNSFSKYCSITDELNQILTCGDNEISISSKDVIAGLDSVIYFSKEGVVEGYKIIVDGYRVTYPNSKELITVRKYNEKKKEKINMN